MPSERDVLLKRRTEQRKKADEKPRYRAVLCASDGSRTTGSVWADENNKRVYFQFFGSGGVGRARCEKLVPELGLGVYVGKTDDNLEWQVLEDDPLLRQTSTDNRNYQAVAAHDLQPGGRLMLWLYSKALLPLATFPNTTGLIVNVVGGDYPYLGTRKTLVNQFNIDLSGAQPLSGEHRYVGIYINSSNTIATVNGTAVAVASTPPEPTWPAGAFRLSVVRIANPQSTIVFSRDEDATNDILDRRMLWSDEQGSVEAASQATVDAGTNTTEFVNPSTLANTTLIERANPNLAYNGSIAIWQRGTSFAAVTDGQYTADGWKYRLTAGTMVHTISRSTDVPTVAQAGILAPYSLLVDCTTADASIAAADLVTIGTRVEGFDFAQIAQRGFGVSFWVWATKTGIYCISFRNSGADRSYVAEFTINTTATWEYKTILVSASPSAGTWDYTTGIGLAIEICLAGGSDYNTTAGAWQTGSFLNTSNQVNGVDSASNDFRIALFDIFPGSWDRPFPVEDHQKRLNRCLRYAWVLDASSNTATIFNGSKYATANVIVIGIAPVTMRTAPTLSHNITGYTAGAPGTTTVALFDLGTGGFKTITGALTFSLGAANTQQISLAMDAGTSWSGTAGDLCQLRIGPGVVAVLSAEL